MTGRRGRAALILALVWGYAEATLFFIVPDVLISFIVVAHGVRRAAWSALIAAAGAALGGLTMYAWAATAPEAARAAIAALPAIDMGLVERAQGALADGGYWAMLRGSFTGTPYKVFAVGAGALHWPWWQFVLLTPLVRLPRFLVTIVLTAPVGHLFVRRLSVRACLTLLAGFWVVFYAIYFSAMRG